jgi:hypothetical protein
MWDRYSVDAGAVFKQAVLQDELVHMGRIVEDLPDRPKRWSRLTPLLVSNTRWDRRDCSITRRDCLATKASPVGAANEGTSYE